MSLQEYPLHSLQASPRSSYDHGHVEEATVGGEDAAHHNNIKEPLIAEARMDDVEKPTHTRSTWLSFMKKLSNEV